MNWVEFQKEGRRYLCHVYFSFPLFLGHIKIPYRWAILAGN